MQLQQKAADSAVTVGWLGWLISHIEQVNGLLQFVLLVTSIAATLVAMRYHWRRTPK